MSGSNMIVEQGGKYTDVVQLLCRNLPDLHFLLLNIKYQTVSTLHSFHQLIIIQLETEHGKFGS